MTYEPCNKHRKFTKKCKECMQNKFVAMYPTGNNTEFEKWIKKE
jgi:hypothetical protein